MLTSIFLFHQYITVQGFTRRGMEIKVKCMQEIFSQSHKKQKTQQISLKVGELKNRKQNIKMTLSKWAVASFLYTFHSSENNYFLLKIILSYSPRNENIVYFYTFICIHKVLFSLDHRWVNFCINTEFSYAVTEMWFCTFVLYLIKIHGWYTLMFCSPLFYPEWFLLCGSLA